jgi:hypothetical protein
VWAKSRWGFEIGFSINRRDLMQLLLLSGIHTPLIAVSGFSNRIYVEEGNIHASGRKFTPLLVACDLSNLMISSRLYNGP